MKKRSSIALLVAGIMVASLASGCGLSSDTEEESDVVSSEETLTITDETLLESGQVYVYRDGVYYPLYIAEATFSTSDDDSSSSSDSRTVWFSAEDWENIPTLYEGDTLVYHYDEDLDETFYIERFEYVGWTFGVANLTQTTTGRYSYSGDDTDNVDTTSTAANLLTLGEYTLILDKVGGVSLRSGNITRGGLVIGLEEGMAYEVEAYVGTNLNTLTLVADRIALTSMSDYSTTDYTFLQGTTVEIHLPELKDGYYAVNGSGIFRLVNGTSWDEDTDFNEEDEEDVEEETEEEIEEEAEEESSSAGEDVEEDYD